MMADKDDDESVNTKKSKTLIIRHLPADLTREEKVDILKYFGAVSVRVLSDKGVLVGPTRMFGADGLFFK